MKKSKLFLLFAILAGCILITSCGATFDSASNNYISETQVRLDSNNFKVIKQVSGESSATYIFGIGGLSRKALEESAYSDMLKNAGLTGSQTLVNISYYVKTANILSPIYFKRTAHATAYVIEFVE